MTNDLRAALADLGREERAAAPPLPLAALASRARRIRRVRASAAATLATVVVVGVVWAGTAVAGLGEPAPVHPADSPIGPAPTSYAGPACGTRIDQAAVFDDPPLVIEMTLGHQTIDPAEPLSGRVVVAATEAFDSHAFEFDGALEALDYTAVRDGVVVGYGRSDLVDGSWQTLSGRQGVTALATVLLRPCNEDTSAWPAGDYELLASMPVTIAEEGADPDSRTILGGPWPFTVRDDALASPTSEPDGPHSEPDRGTPIWDPVAASAAPCGEPFPLDFVDSPLIEVTGGIVLGTYDPNRDQFRPDGGSSHLVVSTWFRSETLSPINGTFTERTYLLDGAGVVAFWDFHRIEDGDWGAGTEQPTFLLYEARNCLTGEPLAGTYRVIMAVTRIDPALEAPDVEVGELERVQFPMP